MKLAEVLFTNYDGTFSDSFTYLTEIEDLKYGDTLIVEGDEDWPRKEAMFMRYDKRSRNYDLKKVIEVKERVKRKKPLLKRLFNK